MDNNKSIDGLTVRRPRKSTASSVKPPKTSSSRPKSNNPKSTPTKTVKTRRTPTISSRTLSGQPILKTSAKPTSKPKTKKPSKKPSATRSSAKPSKAPTINDIQAPAKPVHKSAAEDFLSPVQSFNFDEDTGELQASNTINQTDATTTPIDEPISTEEELSLDGAASLEAPAKKSRKEKKAEKRARKEEKKAKKAKKSSKKKRNIIISISVIFVVLLIAAAVVLFLLNGMVTKMGSGGSIFDLFTEQYDPLKTDENGRTNILAFGTSGYDMEGTEGDGTHDGAQLTDSIMVISFDQETGDLAMLSLPRDLKVSSSCTATGKINEVYWCNNTDGDNEQAGAEALTSVVSDILGIDIQYYAHLNWGSLVQIVDILGGVTVTLDEDIEDYYYTKAVFEAGTPYTIDGAQALGLARARHGTASGDFSRGASQQKILLAIKDRVLEKDLSLTDLLDLANTLSDNLRTNFTVSEMKTLAHLATTLDFNNIRQVSLIEPERLMTTGTINGISYVLPSGGTYYYAAIQEYVAKMFSSDPRKYEDASILILNGTDTSGLAGTEQEALESEGYGEMYIDDAPAGEYSAAYTLYALSDDKPGTKKLLEEKYSITALTKEDLPAGIYTDCDFVLIIGDGKLTTSSTDQEQ